MIRILRTILKIDSQLGKNASQTAIRTRLIRALNNTEMFIMLDVTCLPCLDETCRISEEVETFGRIELVYHGYGW